MPATVSRPPLQSQQTGSSWRSRCLTSSRKVWIATVPEITLGIFDICYQFYYVDGITEAEFEIRVYLSNPSALRDSKAKPFLTVKPNERRTYAAEVQNIKLLEKVSDFKTQIILNADMILKHFVTEFCRAWGAL